MHGNLREIEVVEHADVDGRAEIALRVQRFAVRQDAAGLAEAVLDLVLVERVRGQLRLTGDLDRGARREPQQ
jgi:hypothetical protein